MFIVRQERTSPIESTLPMRSGTPALRRQDRNLVKSELSCLRKILANR
jgi:hypothetical protein